MEAAAALIGVTTKRFKTWLSTTSPKENHVYKWYDIVEEMEFQHIKERFCQDVWIRWCDLPDESKVEIPARFRLARGDGPRVLSFYSVEGTNKRRRLASAAPSLYVEQKKGTKKTAVKKRRVGKYPDAEDVVLTFVQQQ